MIKRIFGALLAAALIGLGSVATAASAPDALVKSVMDDVLEIVRTDPALKAGDTSRAVELVEEKVLPHFDFRIMTSLAVGRDWRQATPAQKEKLVAAFRTMLVRLYSNALTQYRDQTIDFKPLRAGAADTDVLVRTQVLQPGAKAVDIDYALEKQGEAWKVYDVIVAGGSLVTNYRNDFRNQILSGGIDGLIASLEAKNAELAGAAK
ncbi:MAG: ABC transporter substrate-binding protein [Rhodocyclaceae bacterium]|nr:ABC transporter substrate-binding protein [Rhodocyclaceae bacterium]MCB1962993.1 ABC transporter substrate-binding protein [Rhodocyclaceae bacterium]